MFNEVFDNNMFNQGFLLKAAQVVPEMGVVLGRLFEIIHNGVTFLNARFLPLISSTMQIKEMPFMWLVNRIHTIVEQRQQNPISRVDLLQLMLQVTTNEVSEVSQIFWIKNTDNKIDLP